MSTTVEVPVEAPAVTGADVLERAADLLGEYGWCQGRNGGKRDGAMCAGMAVIEADFDLGWDGTAYNLARSQFPAANIPAWNDAPGRTKAEVVQRLRDAAARAREVPA